MSDLISRQAAIDALWKALYEYEDKTLAVIERKPWRKFWDKCYLVNVDGLVKVR